MRTRDLDSIHLITVYGFAMVMTARYFMAGKLHHGVLALIVTAALITVSQRQLQREQRHHHQGPEDHPPNFDS